MSVSTIVSHNGHCCKTGLTTALTALLTILKHLVPITPYTVTQNPEYRQKVAGTMVVDSRSILLPLSIESVTIKVATVPISDFVMPYVNVND